MTFQKTSVPQLLVSVQSANEVPHALIGKADIIDIKETSRGSLGMADPEEIHKIRNELSAGIPVSETPLSAALGELTDWEPGISKQEQIPKLPDLSFVKVGLAEMGNKPDWQRRLTEFQNRFNNQQKIQPCWVSVIYADWFRCNAPQPEKVIDFAINSKAAVVLYDTAIKDGKSLFDHISVEQLKTDVKKIQSHGLKVALAGSLKLESISKLVTIQPDIIAIRGAACEQGNRTNNISSIAISEFKQKMQDGFQASKTLQR
jgi:(5-formylfuran-3-yl)methyl phosphate synthase